MGEFAHHWKFKLIGFSFRFMMATPLNIKPVNTNKQQYYLRQKEGSLTTSQNSPHIRSHSRDLSQPARPRSLQKSKSKPDQTRDKYNTSESEVEGRHLQTEISRKTKMKGPKHEGKPLTKRQMSSGI